MKILLISLNITKSPYPVYPLGLSVIAGALKSTEHTVKQFDFLNNDCSFFLLERKIETFNPDIIGISIRNIDFINQLNNIYYIDNVKDIVASVRKCSPAKIILGGYGFSIMPELILKRTNADYGIVREGEKLILDFVNDAANNVFPEIKCIYSDSFLNGNDIGIPDYDYDSEILKYYLKHGSMLSVISEIVYSLQMQWIIILMHCIIWAYRCPVEFNA